MDVPLLSPRSTDEYAPVPPGPRQRRALHRTVAAADHHAPRLDLTTPEYLRDRVGTAAALRALDAEHGGGFFDIPPEAEVDPAAADECFAALGPVVGGSVFVSWSTGTAPATRPARGGRFTAALDVGSKVDGTVRSVGG